MCLILTKLMLAELKHSPVITHQVIKGVAPHWHGSFIFIDIKILDIKMPSPSAPLYDEQRSEFFSVFFFQDATVAFL
jgi:hypothetical protein